MKFRPIFLSLMSTVVMWSCGSSRKMTSDNTPSPASENANATEPKTYHGSVTKLHDLIHTKLEVSFDWEQQQMPGIAELTLKPHFFTTNKLFLDAKGMDLREVKIKKGETKSELAYEYRNDSICITLDKNYTRLDTFIVYIDYIAKPEELPKGGSAAITSDKGLYFINALGTDIYKPQQIWTQGETQASSVWFPTIDRPNQKTTQEIYITIDTSFVTLSNGKLVSSIINKSSGTRTDYWRQNLPHAPYLFMMAIGKYAVVKDKWRDIDVTYYVEPDYEKYAREIFNHTPEMMEFYSNILGVDYPWEKYAQVIVRDYVSGAMENTTATLYGEFVQKDDRALLDANNDDIVAHELFHQWFGDLVTCESWSNIALNEGFATYGEYMWLEHKYGRDEADWSLQNDLSAYLREARTKQVNLIRFEYKRQEDMFDRHSYQKGGRVLHLLRKTVGDEAFFTSLKLYLNKNRFGAVEVHDLRLAFEEVTGQDLNWFFNQWFLDKGHPSLKIDYEYDATNGKQIVKIEQAQSFETTPLYTIPVDIDIYTSAGADRHRVIINRAVQTFEFNVASKPLLVNFDAQKMLLCSKTDNHTNEEWITLFKNGKLYLDRYEALSNLMKDYKAGSAEADVVMRALNDPHWHIRSTAIKNSDVLIASNGDKMRQKLMELASGDEKSTVRNDALELLSEKFAKDPEVITLIKNLVNDRSYKVMGTALAFLLDNEPVTGFSMIKSLEQNKNEKIKEMVCSFYVKYGTEDQYEYMTSSLNTISGFSKYDAVQNYGKYLMNCRPEIAGKGLDQIANVGFNHAQWFVRLAASQSLAEINKLYGKPTGTNNEAVTQPGAGTLNERAEMENETIRKKAAELLSAIKSKETNPNLVKIYNKN